MSTDHLEPIGVEERTGLRRIQRRIFEILDGAVMDRANRISEIFIASLVVANVLAIILESMHDLHEAYHELFYMFDLFSVAVFSIEYVLRVWSYGEKYAAAPGSGWQGRKEYLFSVFGMVDFLVPCPFICSCCSLAQTCACCACSGFCVFSSSRATTARWTICLLLLRRRKIHFLRPCFCC